MNFDVLVSSLRVSSSCSSHSFVCGSHYLLLLHGDLLLAPMLQFNAELMQTAQAERSAARTNLSAKKMEL